MMWNVRHMMAGLCTVVLTSATFGATTLVNQMFDESGYSRNMSNPPAGLLDYYFRSGTGSVGLVNDTVIGTGNALQLTATTPGGNVRGFSSSNFNATTLANVDDQITVSFDFRFNVLPTNTQDASHGAFRVGIYNSNGTPVTGDFGSKYSDDTGYGFGLGAGGGAAGLNLKRDYNGAGTLDILGGDFGVGSTSSPLALINDTNKHTFQITLTRKATGTEVAVALDNTTLVDSTDSNTTSGTGFVTTFDNIQIGALSTADFDLRMDNLVISTNVSAVPEAASAGILGAAVAGLLLKRRARI